MNNAWRIYQIMLFLLPLPFGGYEKWAWALYGIIYMAILLSIFSKKELPTLPKNFLYVLYVLALIQIWAFLQYIFDISLSPYDSLISSIKGVGLLCFTASSMYLINSYKRTKEVVWILIASGTFQAFYGSAMVLTGIEYNLFLPKPGYEGDATGTFVNRNHLAGYLEITISLGIGLLIALSTNKTPRGWRQRIREALRYVASERGLIRVLLIVMMTGLVMTHSRMGNTALFISLTAVGIISIMLGKNPPKIIKPLLVSVFLIDIAVVGAFFGLDKVADRVQKTSSDAEQRDEINRDTFKMWQDNAFTGIGAGSFIYVFPAYKSSEFKTRSYANHAHNDYLQFLSEFGLPAFIALFSVVTIATINSIQSMRVRNHPFNFGLGFGSAMALLSLGIHSAVDFNLQIPSNAYMFCLVIVLSFIARWSKPGRKKFI